ncbi:uncharacterized protein LOC131876691 [Cryptomeria japonica]|uniref:uncharacterized protein LOC131876691 n=1 Tax=Cryptomeria japonica TaxID=3369 RepID=UPI0027DA7DE2|nr:uncharacterized protein LOC131876691 [Cryptomeria japonica]
MKKFLGLMVLMGYDLAQSDVSDKRRSICWQAAERAWININFDGASLGNPGHAGVACIARDDQGLIVEKLAEYIGKTTNNIAEFGAILKGVELGMRLGAGKTYLEGDSLFIINAIRNQWVVSWQLRRWLTPITEVLKSFEEFKCHIYREGNGLVDDLAKQLAEHKTIIDSLYSEQ